jgi:hypothetical protein
MKSLTKAQLRVIIFEAILEGFKRGKDYFLDENPKSADYFVEFSVKYAEGIINSV